MITKNFFVCGLTGWCMEILFTSTGSFLKQDKRLIGRTSVWMFPIYGTAAELHRCTTVSKIFRHFFAAVSIPLAFFLLNTSAAHF